MGREIRKVRSDWNHPKDVKGEYIPLHKCFNYNENEVQEGLREGWLKGEPPYYGVPVMPQWPDDERTHFQLYETVTEGTPMTPHFGSKEALVEYLVKHGDFYGNYWARSAAEQFMEHEWAPTMIITGGKIYRPEDGFPK